MHQVAVVSGSSQWPSHWNGVRLGFVPALQQTLTQ